MIQIRTILVPTDFTPCSQRAVAYAAALAYEQRSLDDEIAVIEATRRQMLRILGSLPDSAFARAGVHSTVGPLSLEQLLDKVTWHLEHHVQFIDEKRQALGLA